MIERYQKQAIQSGIWFAAASVTAGLCVVLAKLNTNLDIVIGPGALAPKLGSKPAIFFGLAVAILFVTAGIAAVFFYCRAILTLAQARGPSSAGFTSMFVGPFLALFLLNWITLAIIVGVLLGPCLPLIIALLLPDKGNPTRDQDDARYSGARCVQCSGRIPAIVKLCPHCGWTQPAGDTIAPSPTTSASSATPAAAKTA